MIQSYYSTLFSTNQVDYEEVIDCIPQSISQEQNIELNKEITKDEIKSALFSMHPNKAPRPDGMIPAFFQRYWHIVGDDVYKVLKHFFSTSEILQGLNNTNIVLIPKKKNPAEVGDLRHIALCNVLMKIITKVMANRMKGLLNMVITDTQTAFIPGRLISDKIMVSYEIMHYLKGKKYGKEGYMTLKLDMSKAYDRIE